MNETFYKTNNCLPTLFCISTTYAMFVYQVIHSFLLLTMLPLMRCLFCNGFFKEKRTKLLVTKMMPNVNRRINSS